ncbi:MAG: response regulator [Chloroflexaceae bacterium]|nr:response regulator [Chloroflexaceae bacterium]
MVKKLQFLKARLSQRIGLWVLVSILIIEAIIVIPSYLVREQELLGQLEEMARVEIDLTFRLAEPEGEADQFLLELGNHIVANSQDVVGLALYRLDGTLVATAGEMPESTLTTASTGSSLRMTTADGTRYEFAPWWNDWSDYRVIARVDSSEVQQEVFAYAWRMVFFILIIVAFVTVTTMLAVGHTTLIPLLTMRQNVLSFGKNGTLDGTDDQLITRDDELGDVAKSFVAMVGQIAERTSELTTANRQLQHQNTYLEALNDTTIGMISHLEINELLKNIISQSCMLIGAEQGFIFLHDDEANDMRLSVSIGVEGDFLHYRIKPGQGLIGQVWQTGQPMAHEGYYIWTERVQDVNPALLHPIMAVPLKTQDRVVGVISMAYTTPGRTFTTAEIDLFSRFAQLASVALENARLFTEARVSHAAAEAASKAKSVFLATMSHELRTPLNAILGFSQVLQRDTNLTTGQHEYLHIISTNGENLLDLINDVLEMSKIEAGRTTLHRNDFDLYRMLDNLSSMFHLRAVNKGLALHIACGADVPQHLHADERKLRQVLINLLNNAIKFTETGSVTLQVNLLDEQPASDGSLVRLGFAVVDTGPGIERDELPNLFTPFFQARSGRELQRGTGLGLAISREFVNLMSGDITVESVVGQGSVFRFDIQATVATSTAAPVGGGTQRHVVGMAPDQPNYRMLVVEDQPENRMLLEKLLQPLGFELYAAVNGQQGIEQWQQVQPQLILLDMQMPVLNGYDAARRIRAMGGQQPIIIALSASVFEEDHANMLAAGCDDVAHKPIQIDELFGKIAQHLGVCFVYSDSTELAHWQTARPSANQLTGLKPADLLHMPEWWRAALHMAAAQGDAEHALYLIGQVPPAHAAMAHELGSLVQNFRLDQIIELLHPDRAPVQMQVAVVQEEPA